MNGSNVKKEGLSRVESVQAAAWQRGAAVVGGEGVTGQAQAEGE